MFRLSFFEHGRAWTGIRLMFGSSRCLTRRPRALFPGYGIANLDHPPLLAQFPLAAFKIGTARCDRAYCSPRCAAIAPSSLDGLRRRTSRAAAATRPDLRLSTRCRNQTSAYNLGRLFPRQQTHQCAAQHRPSQAILAGPSPNGAGALSIVLHWRARKLSFPASGASASSRSSAPSSIGGPCKPSQRLRAIFCPQARTASWV